VPHVQITWLELVTPSIIQAADPFISKKELSLMARPCPPKCPLLTISHFQIFVSWDPSLWQTALHVEPQVWHALEPYWDKLCCIPKVGSWHLPLELLHDDISSSSLGKTKALGHYEIPESANDAEWYQTTPMCSFHIAIVVGSFLSNTKQVWEDPGTIYLMGELKLTTNSMRGIWWVPFATVAIPWGQV